MKRSILRKVTIMVLAGFIGMAVNTGFIRGEDSKELVTTPQQLLNSIHNSRDNEIIYVGDIDFTAPEGMTNEFVRINVNRNIIIRSGYEDRNAVFTNGSFNIAGGKIHNEFIVCSFENITFDGAVDIRKTTSEDWIIPYNEEEDRNEYREPLKAQYAVNFVGNVKAGFKGCVFENYMYEYGPAINAFYGDYTAIPSLLEQFGDYSACCLDIKLDDCQFKGNGAMYGGGAIYLEGNSNISLNAVNSVFEGNCCGCNDFTEGGGACCLNNVYSQFLKCEFSSNQGNHDYGDNRPDIDRSQGGALHVSHGTFCLIDSLFKNNQASLGGALYLFNAQSEIDGCTFYGNRAHPQAINPEQESGPWSSMGLAGAIYTDTDPDSPVRIYQSEFVSNSALYGYGSIYGYYSDVFAQMKPLGLGSIDLYLCTLKGNTVETEYDYVNEQIYPWASHPGNVLDIEYLKMHGCIFIDETFEKDFPTHQLPCEENDYCYYSSSDDFDEKQYPVSNEQLKKWDIDWYGKNPQFTVGSNYSSELYLSYFNKQEPHTPWYKNIYVIIGSAAAIAITAYVLIRKKKHCCEEKAVKNELNEKQIEELRNNPEIRQLLTKREMEVMCEYIRGASRSELAEKLFISEATAKTHLSNIYAKLNVSSRYELIQKLKSYQ